jgi:hypothetical protein
MRIGIIHFSRPFSRAIARLMPASIAPVAVTTPMNPPIIKHEERDVDGIGGVAARIVEAGDRGQNDVKKTLRIGVGGRVRSRYGNVLAERLGGQRVHTGRPGSPRSGQR